MLPGFSRDAGRLFMRGGEASAQLAGDFERLGFRQAADAAQQDA